MTSFEQCQFCEQYPPNSCSVCHAGICMEHTTEVDGKIFCPNHKVEEQKGVTKMAKLFTPNTNIGQRVIVRPDGTRIILSVYSQDGQTGYIKRDGKRVKVQFSGEYVDSRKLQALWNIIQ